MRVLEARFNVQHKTGAVTVVVGRVLCDGRQAVIEPAPATATVQHLDQSAMLTKLRFLVEASLPMPFERLRQLKSDFWSFVEIDPATAAGAG